MVEFTGDSKSCEPCSDAVADAQVLQGPWGVQVMPPMDTGLSGRGRDTLGPFSRGTSRLPQPLVHLASLKPAQSILSHSGILCRAAKIPSSLVH